MSKIFISYRRSDSPDVTGRIFDYLRQNFSRDDVFRDLDSLPPGADFRAVITEAVQACDVVIVIIGAGWLKAKNKKGALRLSDPNDFVRLEIEGALARKIPIIPVLVGGTKIPAAETLPSSIQPLAFRQAIVVRSDPDFRNDVGQLVRALQRVTTTNTSLDRIRHSGILRTVLIFVGFAIALILLSRAGIHIRQKIADQRRPESNNQNSVNAQTSPSEANSSSPDSLVHNLEASSKKDYRLARLNDGAMAYIDRNSIFTNIPSFLQGQTFITTANADKCPDGPSFNLRFGVSRPVSVYIAHDDRYATKPAWMAGFKKSKESITLASAGSHQKFSLYQKDFSAGTIVLGSNVDNKCQEGSFAMYSVIIAPADGPARIPP
jgi:hypothetical protein